MASVKTVTLLFLCCELLFVYGADINYQIHENYNVGQYVGNIVLDANLSSRPDFSSLSLTYSFLTQGYPWASNFDINENTGVISIKQRVDRESVCLDNPKHCYLDLAVFVQSISEIIKISVEVLDDNDNDPVFPKPEIEFKISESVPINNSFLTHGASDKDYGDFGVKRYELVALTPLNGAFGLVEQLSELDGTTEVGLRVLKKLDREARSSYSVAIVAYDGGIPSRSGSVRITISVQDVNDNKPKFEKTEYNVTIMEDIEQGRSVIQLTANDQDDGTNGKVVYSFSGATASYIRDLFEIEPETGLIKTKNKLRWSENANRYQITVFATDQGTPNVESSRTTVTIWVKDINDNEPQININVLAPEIPEHETREVPVAHILVSDKDSGDNGKVLCRLSTQDFELRKYQNSDYEFRVVLKTNLDREVKDTYNITVLCQDGGNPPVESFDSFTIKVADINDHFPVFLKEMYKATTVENAAPGTSLVQVNATDLDIGDNGRITYSLGAEAGDHVYIEADTGIIAANGNLDREQKPTIEFRVIAADNGKPPKRVTATVSITLEDTNDQPPKFDKDLYRFMISENISKYALVGTVTATDEDQGLNGQVWYDLDKTLDASELFTIDPNSGRITNNQSLDRERQSTYRLNVIARDRGLPSILSSTVEVIISVTDENDNAPIFTYPRGENTSVTVSYGTPVGITVAIFKAVDDDAGDNAKLSFFIEEPDAHNIFKIDVVTGELIVSREMHSDDTGKYKMVIGVRDSGNPPRLMLLDFYVTVSSLPYPSVTDPGAQPGSTGIGQNLVIVIALASVSAVLSVILIVAIIMIKRQDKNNHAYNCRTEAQRALNSSRRGSETSNNNHKHENGECIMREHQISHRTESSLLGGMDHHQDMRHSPGGTTNSNSYRSHPSFSSSLDQKVLETPQAHSSTVSQALSPEMIYEMARDKPMELNALALQRAPPHGSNVVANRTQPQMISKDVEAREIIELLKRSGGDGGSDGSECSADISNADSGRGASEEDLNTRGTGQPTQGGEGYYSRQFQATDGNLKSILHPNARFHRNRISSDSGVYMTNSNSVDDRLHGDHKNNKTCNMQVVSEHQPYAAQLQTPNKVLRFSNDIDYRSNSEHSQRDSECSESEESESDYSGADVEGVLDMSNTSNKGVDTSIRSNSSNQSSRVDPNELCEQIDNLFFRDMMV